MAREEVLKTIRSACSQEGYSVSVIERRGIMERIVASIGPETREREAVVASEVLWCASMKGSSITLIEMGVHKAVVQALQIHRNCCMIVMNLLICIKAFASHKLAIPKLVESDIIPALFGIIPTYRETNKNVTNILAQDNDEIDLCKLSLVMDLIRLVLENGFLKTNDDHNVFADIILNLDLVKFRSILEAIIEDRVQILRSLNSSFIKYLCDKNLVENILLIIEFIERIERRRGNERNLEQLHQLRLLVFQGFEPALKDKISFNNHKHVVTVKLFSEKNYPNGDNRMFVMNGPHTFMADVLPGIRERYGYMGTFIPIYKNEKGEQVTVDSDEIYNEILFETFKDSYRREGDIVFYVRELNSSSSFFGSYNQNSALSSQDRRFSRMSSSFFN